MTVCVVQIDSFVVGNYVFKISICGDFLSQFNDDKSKEKVSHLNSRN